MYLKLDTLTPCTESDIQQAFPNTSFPSQFTPPDGYAVLFAAPQPSHDPITQSVRPGTPVLTDKGHWEQTWEVIDLDAETIAANQEAAAESRWTRIKALRDSKAQTGGYRVGTKWFHSDTFSRTQQMGLVMMGANVPAGLQWKTLDGSFVTMTPTLAGQIFAAAAAQDASLFAHAEALKQSQATDIESGWPATFEPTVG